MNQLPRDIYCNSNYFKTKWLTLEWNPHVFFQAISRGNKIHVTHMSLRRDCAKKKTGHATKVTVGGTSTTVAAGEALDHGSFSLDFYHVGGLGSMEI